MVEKLQELFISPYNAGSRRAVIILCALVALIGGAYIAFLSPLIAWGLTVALIGAWLVATDIQWGFLALVGVICLLPFGVLPLRLGFSPTFLDAVMLAIFLVWVADAALNRRQIEGTPIGLPIVVFILWAFASFVAGLGHAELTATILRRFVEIIIAISLFFVVVNTVKEKKVLERILLALGLAGLAEAIIGIVLYYLPSYTTVRILSALGRFGYPTGWGVLRYVENNPELPLRATATSIDPNVLGGTLVMIIVLLTPQLFTSRPLLPRYITLPALGIMWFCLYLTYSRSALIGLIAALIIMGILRYRPVLVLLGIAAALILLLPQAQPYLERLQAGLKGADLATKMRFGEYKDALILISRYPLFGVGFAGTPDIDIYIGVSSLYLLMAENMGLIGVSVFLIIVGRFFAYVWQGWRATGEDPRLEAVLLGFGCALGGALVGGIFDHYFFNLSFTHSVALFWLYMGLATAAAKLALEKGK